MTAQGTFREAVLLTHRRL